MFGFLIGAAALAGLFAMRHHHHHDGCGCEDGGQCGHGGHGGRCGHGGGCGPRGRHRGWHGHGHHHHHHRGRGGPPWAGLWRVHEELDLSGEQERDVRRAVRELRDEALPLRDKLRGAAAAVAAGLRSDPFDGAELAKAFVDQNAALESAQKAFERTAERIHEVLDEEQRLRLADFLEDVAKRAGRWGGPYRDRGMV